ncbi:MAG TPA: 3-oxoacyl-[acyl-carrier-protein] reductase [Fimbriimonadales bacterium]|nr:3-oxoacyl-[acyl-carrier-protein] reductase [Fimbriimonadales bacterium]
MSLEGKVAIITGASRGIGKEIAIALAREGADVACIAKTVEALEKTINEITSLNKKALALACDVGVSEETAKSVEQVLQSFGRIDILINNAGITRDNLILRMKDEDWDEVIRVNLKGAFHMIREVAKPMLKARYGRIVNITSIVGISGQVGQANYAASKAGLIGLTKAVAKELGGRGITCNAVAPGFIESDMTRGLGQEMREEIIKRTPLGRLGTAEDVTGAVVFLSGDSARYITGQVLIVDGGLTL